METRANQSGRAVEAGSGWGTPILIGILLMVVGVAALLGSTMTGFVSVLFLGGVLVAAGVLDLVQAFRPESGRPRALLLLGGVLSLVVGFLFAARPAVALAAVTLLLAAYFLVSGVFRGAVAAFDRYPGWPWDLAYGAVSVLLGIIVVADFPTSALWLLGTLVGIEVFMRGLALLVAAVSLRRVLRPQAA